MSKRHQREDPVMAEGVPGHPALPDELASEYAERMTREDLERRGVATAFAPSPPPEYPPPMAHDSMPPRERDVALAELEARVQELGAQLMSKDQRIEQLQRPGNHPEIVHRGSGSRTLAERLYRIYSGALGGKHPSTGLPRAEFFGLTPEEQNAWDMVAAGAHGWSVLVEPKPADDE